MYVNCSYINKRYLEQLFMCLCIQCLLINHLILCNKFKITRYNINSYCYTIYLFVNIVQYLFTYEQICSGQFGDQRPVTSTRGQYPEVVSYCDGRGAPGGTCVMENCKALCTVNVYNCDCFIFPTKIILFIKSSLYRFLNSFY